MPRAMSSLMLAAIQSGELQPAVFLEATFRTGPIYIWTGYGTINWNGQNWQGIGDLGTISVIEESGTVEAKGITLGISGFDSTWLTAVVGEVQLGAPVIVYLGMFSGGVLLNTPIIAFAGRLDLPTIEVSGPTAAIAINCENRMLDMNTPATRRLTNDDQQLVQAGDLGLSFVSGIAEVTVYWGIIPSTKNNV